MSSFAIFCCPRADCMIFVLDSFVLISAKASKEDKNAPRGAVLFKGITLYRQQVRLQNTCHFLFV